MSHESLIQYFSKHLPNHSLEHLKQQAHLQGWNTGEIEYASHRAHQRRKKRPYLFLFLLFQLVIIGSAFFFAQPGGSNSEIPTPLPTPKAQAETPSGLSVPPTGPTPVNTPSAKKTSQATTETSPVSNPATSPSVSATSSPIQSYGSGKFDYNLYQLCIAHFKQQKEKNRLKDLCDGSYYFEASNYPVDAVQRIMFYNSFSGYGISAEPEPEGTLQIYGWKNPPNDISTTIGQTNDSMIHSYVASITEPYTYNFSFAVMTLPYTGRIASIFECAEADIGSDNLSCANWKITDIPFSTNKTHVQFITDHFTGFAAGANANLTIFDTNDSLGGSAIINVSTVVILSANYTDVGGGALTSATCQAAFNTTSPGPVTMTYDSNAKTYFTNRSFSQAGSFTWNVTCSLTGFNTLTANDTISVFGNNLPLAQNVNISSNTLNTSTTGSWNYTDIEGEAENGTVYTWYINGTEAWKEETLIGYWKLDGDTLDSSNYGNNGTIQNGATSLATGGIIRGGYLFTLEGSNVTVPDSSKINNSYNSFSIEAWIHPKVTGTIMSIVDKRKQGIHWDGYAFYIQNNRALGIQINEPGQAADYNNIETNAGVIPSNQWSYVTVTVNRQTITNGVKLYLDGVLLKQADTPIASSKSIGNSVSLLIGGHSSNSSLFFNGTVDELKIWNRTLSAQEVSQGYHMMKYGQTDKIGSGSAAPDIPVDYWSFDEGSDTQTSDYFGDNNGSLNGGITFASGLYGSTALKFDGVNDYVDIPDATSLKPENAMTIIMWCNATASNTRQCLVSKHNLTTKTGYALFMHDDNRFYFQVGDGVGTANCAWCQTVNSSAITATGWYHVAGVYNSTYQAIYVNGTIQSQIGTGGLLEHNTQNLWLGRNTDTQSEYEIGIIDELSIYNRVLSTTEINQSYQRNFPLFGYNTSLVSEGSTISFGVQAADNEGIGEEIMSPSKTITGSAPEASRVNITPLIFNATTYPAGTWSYSSPLGNAENGTIYTWFIDKKEAWKESSLKAYFHLDGNVLDSSGNAAHGILSGSPTQVDGWVRAAYTFNGNSQYIDISAVPVSSAFTVGAWVKNYSGRIYGADGSYMFSGDSIGRITLSTKASSYCGSYWTDSLLSNAGVVPVDGNWHYVAFTRNITGYLTLYADSARVGTLQGYSGEVPTCAYGRYIGTARFWDGRLTWGFATGQIDEYKVWDRTLTHGEIQQEYYMMQYGQTERLGTKSGSSSPDIPTAAWQFNEASGTQTADYFGDFNGTVIGTLSRTIGKWNTNALTFNGIDTYVNLDNTSGLLLPNAFTITAWINATSPIGGSIIEKGQVDDYKHNYRLFINSTPRFRIGYGTDMTEIQGNELSIGEWQQISATFNGTHLRLYMNGTLVAGPTLLGGTIFTDSNPAHIGAYYWDNSIYSYFNGTIDDVIIYNRSLSDAEISQNYNHSFPLFGYNTSAYTNTSGFVFQITPSDGITFGLSVNSTSLETTSSLSHSQINMNQTIVYKTDTIRFNTTWTSAQGLNFYIFSINQSTEWTNTSSITMGGTTNISTNISTITANAGTNVQWRFYAENSLGTQVETPIQTFTVTNHPPQILVSNITPTTINSTIYASGNWNYSDIDQDPENGTLYTWYLNGNELWDENDLVGYWRLDANTLDHSRHGNNATAYNGVNSTYDGLIRNAYQFDGINDFIEIPDGNTYNFKNITAMAWIRLAGDIPPTQWRIINQQETQGKSWGIEVCGSGYPGCSTNQGNQFFFHVGDGSSSWINTFATTNLSPNKWYHVAAVNDGTNQSVYINGRLESSNTSYGPVPTIDIPIKIGSLTQSPGYYFNGTIDEVKLFNRTLAAEEISQEYQMMSYGQTDRNDAGTPAPDIPQHQFSFNEGSGTTTFDYFGDLTGTIANGAWVNGRWGTSALRFSGVGAATGVNLSNPPSLSITQDITILAWIFMPSFSTTSPNNLSSIIAKNRGTPTTRSYNLEVIGSGTPGVPYTRFYINGGGGVAANPNSSATNIVTGQTLVVNRWYQIAAVKNGTTLSLYTNGELNIQAGGNSNTINATIANVLIGNMEAGSGRPFNGTIDQVEIYNRSLTAAEIKQDYNKRFPTFGLNTSSLGTITNLTFEVTAGDTQSLASLTQNSSPEVGCGIISSSTTLDRNVVAQTAACFEITNNNAVLDCNGFSIDASAVTDAAILVSSSNLAAIKNCRITGTNTTIRVTGGINDFSMEDSDFGGGIVLFESGTHNRINITNNTGIGNLTLNDVSSSQILNNSINILTANSGNSVSFLNNTFSNSVANIFSLTGSSFSWNTFSNYQLQTPNPTNFINNTFIGGQNTSGAMLRLIADAHRSLIINNKFSNGPAGSLCFATHVSNTRIEGNTFTNCTGTSIFIDSGGGNNTVTNNTLFGSAASGFGIQIVDVNNTIVAFNTINSTGWGALIYGNYTTFANNTLLGQSDTGIQLVGRAHYNTFLDNIIANASVRSIWLSGGTTGNSLQNTSFRDIGANTLVVSDSLNNSLRNFELITPVKLENTTQYFATVLITVSTNISDEINLSDFFNLGNNSIAINISKDPLAQFITASLYLNYSGTGIITPEAGIDSQNDFVFTPCGICAVTSTANSQIAFDIPTLTDETNFARYKATRFWNVTNPPAGFTISNTRGTSITLAETTQLIQLRTSGVRRAEFTITGGTNLSYLNLSTDSEHTVSAGWNQIPNMSNTHILYIPNSNNNRGVYVCPYSVVLNDVTIECVNSTSFGGPFPQTKSVISDLVTVTINGTDYRTEGLSGSGVGPLPPGVLTDARPAAVTVVRREKSVSQTDTIPIVGGNITGIYLSEEVGTRKWQGYYGNTTGKISIGSSDSTLFDFGIANPQFVAVSQDQNFNFQTARAANTTWMDYVFGFNTSESDSATIAFNASGRTMGGVADIPYMNIQNGTWATGIIDNGSPSSINPGLNNSYAFVVGVNKSQKNFAGNYSDFEMIVPVPLVGSAAGTATYYFFIEIA